MTQREISLADVITFLQFEKYFKMCGDDNKELDSVPNVCASGGVTWWSI